jgi:nucleoside-diphosphate-sugar epimerase
MDLGNVNPVAPIDFDYCIVASTSSAPKTGGLDDTNLGRSSAGAIALIGESLQEYEKSQVILHLSSGAVHPNHGKQNFHYSEIRELGQPTTPYISTKLNLELGLHNLAMKFRRAIFMNPRLFAFYGPLLPLDAHFAIGNFMASIVAKKEISIKGSPNTVRSYLHAADLASTIIKMMSQPEAGPFNIGSETEVTMLELAKMMTDILAKENKIEVINSQEPSYYVPSTSRTFAKYGVIESIEFQKGIRDWYQWILEN